MHSKRNIHQDGLLAIIGERNAAQSDITGSWNGLGTLLCNRHIKQVKDLVRRCHTVHGNVEITAQKTHRQEELSRNQNDKDAFPHNEEVVIYLLNCKNCTKRASTKCNHVHHGDGVELHGQDLHGNAPKMLSFIVHLLVLEIVSLVNLCCSKALQVLQKSIAKLRILAPILGQKLLCKLLDKNNGHGDKRNKYQQNNANYRTNKEQNKKKRERS